MAVAEDSGKASYELDILEVDRGAKNSRRTGPQKVCTKLCFFVCAPVDGVEYFRGGKGMLLCFYVFLFLCFQKPCLWTRP